jgi:hypothetical protein
MKKLALALVIAAIAASPAAAAKKKKAPAEPTNVAAQSPQSINQNSANFARDSLPIFLPSWSMPLYMGVSGRKD